MATPRGWSQGELRLKTDALERGGFTRMEADTLIREGIAGFPEDVAASLRINQIVSADDLMKGLNGRRVNLYRLSHTKEFQDVFRAAGFKREEIGRLMGNFLTYDNNALLPALVNHTNKGYSIQGILKYLNGFSS